MKPILFRLLLGFLFLIPVTPDVSNIRAQIVTVANKKVGSTKWSYNSFSPCYPRLPYTNKCNCFVYDVGIEAGAKMPTRSAFFGNAAPVGAGAGGWGKATSLSYWSRESSKQPGDIVAGHMNNVYHVGIYVGNNKVVSANSKDIGKNSNMFTRGYQDLVYWRYQG